MKKACLVMMIFACACEASIKDNGFVRHEGHQARPLTLPWYVVHDDTIDGERIDDAAEWWETRVDADFFVVDHSLESFDLVSALPPTSRGGYLALWGGYPVGGDELGESIIVWGEEATVVSAEVIIAVEDLTDPAWYTAAIARELGRCLGLADDPDELHSIMSTTLDPENELTPGDLSRIFELLDL